MIQNALRLSKAQKRGKKIEALLILSVVAVCFLMPVSTLAKTGGEYMTFTLKNASPVSFNHEKHVHRFGLKCTDCYYQIFCMAEKSYKIK